MAEPISATRLAPIPHELLLARICMLSRDPWYATWIAGTRWYGVPDADGKPVVATDENLRVFVSPAARALPTSLLAWLLKHEADHWFHQHFATREVLVQRLAAAGSPNPHADWNACCDAPINTAISIAWYEAQRGEGVAYRYERRAKAQEARVWSELQSLTGFEAVTHETLRRSYPEIEPVWIGQYDKTELDSAALVEALCRMYRKQQSGGARRQSGGAGQQSQRAQQAPGQQQQGQAQQGQSAGQPAANQQQQQGQGQPGQQPGAPSPGTNGAQPGQATGQPPSGAPMASGMGQPHPGHSQPTQGPGGMTAGCGRDLPYQCDDPAPVARYDLEAVRDACLDRAQAEVEAQAKGESKPGSATVPEHMRQAIARRETARNEARKVDWTAIFESGIADAFRRVLEGAVGYRYGEPEPICCDPIILAGRVAVAPEVLLVIDVSGSMREYLQHCADQVAAAVDRCGGRCLIATGDTRVLSFREFSAGDRLPLASAGGTRMEVVIPEAVRRAEREGHSPAVVVCLTDGETYWPERSALQGLPLHCVCVKHTSWFRRVPAWIPTYRAWKEGG